jgi:branched-chain amino acid transport system permease protein
MTDVAQAIVNGLLLGAVFALVAVGLTLVFGVMDIVNFAHGEFVMVAMYVGYFSWSLLGLDPTVAVIVAAPAIGLLGLVVFHLVIRPVLGKPPLAQIIVTFGLLVFLRGLAQWLWTPNTRAVRDTAVDDWQIALGDVIVPGPRLVAAAGAVVCTLSVAWFVNRTETGAQLRATGEDARAASLLGIDPHRMYALAWIVAGATTGVAGALLMNYLSVSPDAGVLFGLTSFVVVALGGFGSIAGAAIAGVGLGVAQGIVGLYFPSYTLAAALGVYLVVMLFRPHGLLGIR